LSLCWLPPCVLRASCTLMDASFFSNPWSPQILCLGGAARPPLSFSSVPVLFVFALLTVFLLVGFHHGNHTVFTPEPPPSFPIQVLQHLSGSACGIGLFFSPFTEDLFLHSPSAFHNKRFIVAHSPFSGLLHHFSLIFPWYFFYPKGKLFLTAERNSVCEHTCEQKEEVFRSYRHLTR